MSSAQSINITKPAATPRPGPGAKVARREVDVLAQEVLDSGTHVRIVYKGDCYTMDYVENRVTFECDKDGRVMHQWMG